MQRRIPGKLWRLSTLQDNEDFILSNRLEQTKLMSALLNLLDKIKTKPGLYLGTASITHLRMFIVGYRFARTEAGIASTDVESDFYKNFQPWLQNRLSIHTISAWDKLILLTCINEKAAFDYFFQLLDEFSQRDQKSDIDPMLATPSPQSDQQAA